MNLRDLTLPATYLLDLKSRIAWVEVGKWLSLLLLTAAAFMIVSYARDIDWQGVWNALRGYSKLQLLAAIALTLGSFTVYSCFDLFGRHYTGYRLPAPRVMLITAISYAFNLTLGSIIGAAGIRLRLYQQLGVRTRDVARIMAISVGINWLGYAMVAGTLFAANIVELPVKWEVRATTLPAIGWSLLAIVALYLGATLFFGDRTITVRRKQFCLPTISAAFMQVIVGSANWMIMGGVLYFLMQELASYALTLAVVMFASVAGIISRIPGGIGILEAASIAILGPQLGETKVIAGVLAYRAIYYLSPLLLASLGLLALETLDRRASGET